ncbi:MAG: class I SAM-dependent methyltransferase [Actinomycetota bacterium]|nr:class I SAM-dependent methyltransferase [Actinomycetota bacterium]
MERAMESERSDALFHDPCATDLVGPRGKEIAKKMGRSGWAVTVRTRVLDDLLLRTLREHQVHTVLSLGAGLDARPYRLDLPGDLRWIEVDVPETIDYKERVLAPRTPRCHVERHAADLADRSARERVLALAAPAPALILTEGVLHYLSPGVVEELATDAWQYSAIRWWLLDVAHPMAVTWGRRATTAVDLWQFTPDDGIERFRSWGWRPADVISGWEEARRYGRLSWPMRLAWSLSPRSRRDLLRHISTYALLERNAGTV